MFRVSPHSRDSADTDDRNDTIASEADEIGEPTASRITGQYLENEGYLVSNNSEFIEVNYQNAFELAVCSTPCIRDLYNRNMPALPHGESKSIVYPS